MPDSETPLRLFVAIYPPPAAAAAMLRILDSMDLPDHRATPTDQLHLTLLFIGDTQSRELDQFAESVERSAAGLPGFALQPLRAVTLPERGRPRLVAIETDTPAALLELQRRLVKRLARNPRDAGRFTPHFTLCRFSHSVRALPIDRPISLDPFPIGAVLLMQSTLRSDGARHQVVAEFPLSDP